MNDGLHLAVHSRRFRGGDVRDRFRFTSPDSHALMRACIHALTMLRGMEAGDMDGVERSLIATAATGFLVMIAAVILLLIG
jgi:hypothetical protein